MKSRTKKISVRFTEKEFAMFEQLLPNEQKNHLPCPGVWNWTGLVHCALGLLYEQKCRTPLEVATAENVKAVPPKQNPRKRTPPNKSARMKSKTGK